MANFRACFIGAAVIIAGLAQQLAVAADIRVEDPYARAVPPGQPNSAVFMTLHNGGDALRSLVAARSDVCDVVELHTHRLEDGMMKMRPVERIVVPAERATVLRPGGLHVMLIGLHKPLRVGDQVQVDLTFDDGQTVSLDAPVREVMRPMAHH